MKSVKSLSDYLDGKTLQQVQDAFSAVINLPLLICAADGEPLTAETTNPATWALALGEISTDDVVRLKRRGNGRDGRTEMEMPIRVDGKVVGGVRLAEESGGLLRTKSIGPEHRDMLRLMAAMLQRFASNSAVLRERIQQLLGLHMLLQEITQNRNLQSILDAATRLVVQVTGAKASSIRLLDETGHELRIRSMHAIRMSYIDTAPVKLKNSPLDQEVFREKKPVYVPDMQTDPRVSNNEAARREGLVSGLCAPMLQHDHPVGVLRIFHGHAYQYDAYEVQLLQTVANAVAAAIVNRRLYVDRLKGLEMKRQLTLASEVQRRMVPDKAPKLEGYSFNGVYVPSQDLAGDFYDYIPLAEGNLGIALGDVAGKGARASLLMASVRASLRAHAEHVYEMTEVIKLLNHDLCDESFSSDFATLFYGVLDAPNRVLTYTNAGHPPAILVRNGEGQWLDCGGGLLGAFEGTEFPSCRVELEPGDVVLAYSDGMTEATNFKDEMYGRQRLMDTMIKAIGRNYTLEEIVKYCLWDLRRFAGLRRRDDDRTMVAFRVTDS